MWCLVLVSIAFAEVSAITGGQPAQHGQYPFMVSVRGWNNCHICGGTIIGKRWVITGQPCYSRAFFGYIKFGNTSLEGDCGAVDNQTQIKIDDVLLNPWGVDIPPYHHDLALIHLSEPITFNKNVLPVELPVLDEPWPVNKTATILGWGNASLYPDLVRTELQQAEVLLLTDRYCASSTVWDGWYPENQAVMKCARGVESAYYCTGDYGGPLLYQGKQFGVISYIWTNYTGQCGLYPGIYSPVAYFRQWIYKTTGI